MVYILPGTDNTVNTDLSGGGGVYRLIGPTLKGQLHEIFPSAFFYQSNPPGPLIHILKSFKFGFEFADIFEFTV